MLEHLKEIERKIESSDSADQKEQLERMEENLFNFE
jgi:hypothetical protein